MKKKQYRAYFKRRFSDDPRDHEWMTFIDWKWSSDLDKVMSQLKEYMDEFDGRPKKETGYSVSKETAKKLMVTDWRIKVRLVEYLEDEDEGRLEYPDVSAMEEQEDCIRL